MSLSWEREWRAEHCWQRREDWTGLWLPEEMFVCLPAGLVFSIFVQSDWAADYPMSLTKPAWESIMCSQPWCLLLSSHDEYDAVIVSGTVRPLSIQYSHQQALIITRQDQHPGNNNHHLAFRPFRNFSEHQHVDYPFFRKKSSDYFPHPILRSFETF